MKNNKFNPFWKNNDWLPDEYKTLTDKNILVSQ